MCVLEYAKIHTTSMNKPVLKYMMINMYNNLIIVAMP